MENYIIEMLHITKEFPGIKANDDITLKLKKGEIHALLGENGAGKSTLMSVLFGLYQPEKGEIKKNGEVVQINGPKDANELGIGMVHQHFKLVEIFTVLENIILGVEPNRMGFLQKKEAPHLVRDFPFFCSQLFFAEQCVSVSIRIKRRKVLLFFAQSHPTNRHSQFGLDGDCKSAFGSSLQFRQHYPGQFGHFIKDLRLMQGILASNGIQHQ